jgi:hypothetical protein
MNENVNEPLKYNVRRTNYFTGVLRRFGWKSIKKSNDYSYETFGNRVLAIIS